MDEILRFEELFSKSADKEIAVFRGVAKRKHIHRFWAEKQDFYYMDTGYFGNFPSLGNPTGKKIYHRIIKNQLQNIEIGDYPADRWESLTRGDQRLCWPGWKKKGRKILLVVPNRKACVFYGFDLQPWLDSTIQTIKQHTDMPIVIRHKGSRSHRGTVSTIYDALDDDIFVTVAFNSIAAIESIVYGIPAFVSVPCAASPLSLNDLSKISTPYYPDRDLIIKHCRGLAYNQFTYDEIANGSAWKIIQNYTK